MRIATRLRKLEAARPRCGGGVMRLVAADHVPTEEDRCKLCGGCHMLVIEEMVVDSREELEAYRAEHAAGEG